MISSWRAARPGSAGRRGSSRRRAGPRGGPPPRSTPRRGSAGRTAVRLGEAAHAVEARRTPRRSSTVRVARPQQPQDVDRLVGPAAAAGEIDARGRGLAGQRAEADGQQPHPAPGQDVDRGQPLGQHDRVVIRQQQDRRAEQDPASWRPRRSSGTPAGRRSAGRAGTRPARASRPGTARCARAGRTTRTRSPPRAGRPRSAGRDRCPGSRGCS